MINNLQMNVMDIYSARTDLMSLIAASKITLNVIASRKEIVTALKNVILSVIVSEPAAASTKH